MTGSVQEKKGMLYVVLNFKNDEGKRKPKWISTGLMAKGNKRKAEQLLSQYLAEYKDTDYIAPTKIFFADYIADWIEQRRTDVQSTTYDGYIHMLNKHIYPYFKAKGLYLTQVTPMHISKNISRLC